MNRNLAATLSLGALLAASCGPKQSTDTTTHQDGPPPAAGQDEPPPPAAGLPDEAFRAGQPSASEPRSFQLPSIKAFQIGDKDKIDVYLVEQHELPTVSVELSFDGGAMTDPGAKIGLASVCMDMMSEGTKKLDKIAFSEALADVASSVGSFAGDDTQGVSMRSLTRSFDATFALFSDTLTTPGFRKSDLDRMVKRRLEGLKQQRGSASSIAGRVTGVALYGVEHPFGRVTGEKTYKAIRIGDCQAYHKKWIKPRGARLFVVGDMTEERIRAAFTPLLARWKGAPPRLPAPPQPKGKKDRIYFVDVPGSAQSVVSLMHFGPQRKAEDYFATQLLAQALGAGFSSRINMNLREDKGYSYGAGGGFGYNRWFGTFTAQSSVRADASLQSVLELVREVRQVSDGSAAVKPAEIERDKNGTILGMPARFATSASTLGQYRSLIYFGLPLDYWNTYIDRIKSVTLEEIGAAAKAHLKLDQAIYLVVGDGDAKQIVHTPGAAGQKGTDKPLEVEGKPVTLREGLRQLVADHTLGAGNFVELDADGKRKAALAVPIVK